MDVHIVREFRLVAFFLLAIFAFLAPSYGAQYSYDSVGRLSQVVEADGSVIQYSYDANGNMTLVTRTGGSSAVGINSFSPSAGGIGSSVTIHGYGFSSTPSLNTVKFNGVTASVTSANGSMLVVTVPSGATSGPLSVTSPAGSATSASAFTVTTVSVTGFTPTIGAPGTVVTINGTGFDPSPANNAIKFNATAAVATSASATQIQTTVPTGAMAGHITVTTPNGTATSAGVFIAPPTTILPANIVLAGIVTPGGSGLVYHFPTANKVGATFFDGVAGQRVSLIMTNVTAYGTFKIYAPDGSVLYSGQPPNNAGVFDLPALPLTGTYSLYLSPGTSIGSITVRFVTDALGTIATNGTPVSLSLQGGQNGSFTFPATAGAAYNLAITSFASSPSGGSVRATIRKPDGTVLKDCGTFTAGTQGCRFVAAATDTYTLRMDPSGLYATTFTARLNQDVTGVLVAGGSPFNLNLNVPGGNATLTFTTTAGQTVALNFSNVAINPAATTIHVTLIRSNGSYVFDDSITSPENFDLYNLAADTYTVLIVPHNAATVSSTVTLAQQMGGAVPVDGTSASYTAAVAGQNAYFTFPGTAGETLSIALRAVTFAPGSSSYLTVTAYKPDGTILNPSNNSQPLTCYSSSVPGCSRSYRKLPATGTYRLVVTPPSDGTVMGFTLSISPAVTGALVAGGAAQNLNLASPGQNAFLTFTASAGETVALNTGSVVTVPAARTFTTWVFNSAGVEVASTSGNSTMTLNLVNLAADTYSVLIDSTAAVTATASVQLAPLLGGVPPLDGTPATYTASVPGQKAYLSFPGTAGQTISFAFSDVSFTPATTDRLAATLYKPNGGGSVNDPLLPLVCYSSSSFNCAQTFFKLPTTGTYTMIVVPPSTSTTMSFKAYVSQPVSGTLTVGAPAQNITLTSGQAALLSFTTTATQTVVVSATGISAVPTGREYRISVYNAAGTQVGTSNGTSSMSRTLTNLAAGTYSVLIFPSSTSTATMSVAVN